MYSLWKEVSDQIKKKAGDLNNSIQELNVNPLTKEKENEKRNETNTTNSNDTSELNENRKLSLGINEKLNLIKNNKFLSKDLGELQYYNNKFKSGFSNIKKLVGEIYKDSIKNDSTLSNNQENENKKKIYLSKIVPWKKGDIMISKIYRKKYNEGIPITIPDPNINKEVYKQIKLLNVDKERIYSTYILENYNFIWEKKKEQSEQILEEDKNLLLTKNSLVPNYMNEMEFWKAYFFNIDIIYNEIADEIYEKKYILLNNPYSKELSFKILRTESKETNESARINSMYTDDMETNHKQPSKDHTEILSQNTEDILRTYSYEQKKNEPTIKKMYEHERNSQIDESFYPLNIVKPSLSLEKIELSNENEINIENETLMKETKINGLSFYMDNDIYSSLNKQTNLSSSLTFLEGKKGNNDSCIESKENMNKNQNNMENTNENSKHIHDKRDQRNEFSSTTPNEMNMVNISPPNLKPLEEVNAQNELTEEMESNNKKKMKEEKEKKNSNLWDNESVNNTDAPHYTDTPVETDLVGEYIMEEEINYKNPKNMLTEVTESERERNEKINKGNNEVLTALDININDNMRSEKEETQENNFIQDPFFSNKEPIQVSLEEEEEEECKIQSMNDCLKINHVNNVADEIQNTDLTQTNIIHTNSFSNQWNSTEKRVDDLFNINSLESFPENPKSKPTEEFQIQDHHHSQKETAQECSISEPKKEEIKNQISNEDMFFDLMNNNDITNQITEIEKNEHIKTKESNIIDTEKSPKKKSTINLDKISELNLNDINIDDINFEDALEFDFDSNNFDEEELKQFEKDLLET